MVHLFLFLKFNILNNIADDLDQIEVSKSMVCDTEKCIDFVPKEKCLKILTQNVRSIGKNFDGLVVLLAQINVDVDILILTECWLSFSPVIPTLKGYNHCANKIYHNQNEGVIIYWKNTLNINIEEPTFKHGNALVMEFGSEYAIIAIYRSPSYCNIEQFLESLNLILSKLKTFNNIAVMGDVNINITNDCEDHRSVQYLTLLATHGLFPAHLFVTRDKSNSCLDHVMLKSKSRALTIVLQSTLTDHKAVLLCLSFNQIVNVSDPIRSKLNMISFSKNIENLDLESIFQITDPNDAINFLISNLQSLINKHTTTYKVPRSKRILKPWITPGLLKCIKNKDQLHRKHKKFPDNETIRLTYHRYRNFCNDIIKKVKTEYERQELSKAGNDSKKLWKTLKNITHSAKNKQPPHELINLNDPQLSVDEINDYYANVGQNLAGKIPQTRQNYLNIPYVSSGNNYFNSFVMLSTDENEISQLIMNLKNDCSVGWDNISNVILKKFKNKLIPYLTYIFNLCLSQGVFPDALKISLLYPIHKSGDRDRVINYRPISILPSLSKILERIINIRLIKFLEKNKILSDNQFGFRSGRSTDDAVEEMLNFISSSLDQGKKCLGIFLDIAKAFDTVSVTTLLHKLEKSGIRGTQLALFESYLSNRTQMVAIGNYRSKPLPITYGVPQGSILGPTLFLIYINNLCKLKPLHGNIICYADDTALLFTADTWEEVFRAANEGINEVTQWLTNNTLSLNTEKTKYLAFSIRESTQPSVNLCITAHTCLPLHLKNNRTCSCKSLERTQLIKYLGVFIDNNLTFKQHINKLTCRIRKLIYIFKRLRQVADMKILKLTYTTLCQSLLTYCIVAWGGAPKTVLINLEIAQRAVLKVINFYDFQYPTNLLYQKCNVLSVRKLYILNTISKQHSIYQFDANISEHKRRVNDVQALKSYNKFHTSFIRKFLLFLGPYLYKKANKELSIYSKTKHICKRIVSNWLLSKTYDETEDLLLVVC